MKYRRIDKDTVQCIVTGEDMEEYGLTLVDIFERSEKAEDFFRELIEEAHEKVGYECSAHGNIAMQITPFHDDGMIITITSDNGNSVKGFLEHMRDCLQAIAGSDGQNDPSAGPECAGEKEMPAEANASESADTQPGDVRIFEFESLSDVLDFAADGFAAGQVRSYLGKADEKYYLVVIKNRCSWKNFNRLSAKAFDYGSVVADVKNRLVYLDEHGECIIENRALNRLARISKNT